MLRILLFIPVFYDLRLIRAGNRHYIKDETMRTLFGLIRFYGGGDGPMDQMVKSTLASVGSNNIDARDQEGNTLLILASQYACEVSILSRDHAVTCRDSLHGNSLVFNFQSLSLYLGLAYVPFLEVVRPFIIQTDGHQPHHASLPVTFNLSKTISSTASDTLPAYDLNSPIVTSRVIRTLPRVAGPDGAHTGERSRSFGGQRGWRLRPSLCVLC